VSGAGTLLQLAFGDQLVDGSLDFRVRLRVGQRLAVVMPSKLSVLDPVFPTHRQHAVLQPVGRLRVVGGHAVATDLARRVRAPARGDEDGRYFGKPSRVEEPDERNGTALRICDLVAICRYDVRRVVRVRLEEQADVVETV